ncbi:hypothetical protein LTR66_016512 [Elasticomyces elasticus]|nr:hypothetical protein LTR66_016512 [Elasticomyces elasticus]
MASTNGQESGEGYLPQTMTPSDADASSGHESSGSESGNEEMPTPTTTKKPRGVDMTKEDCNKRGAILKPANNTKDEDDYCLTYLRYGAKCQGTDIDEKGKCQSCSGIGPNKGRQIRRCYWQIPSEDVWTYEQAQAHAMGRKIDINTREGREAAGRASMSYIKGINQEDASRPESEDGSSPSLAVHSSSTRHVQGLKVIAQAVLHSGFDLDNVKNNVYLLIDALVDSYERVKNASVSSNDTRQKKVLEMFQELFTTLEHMRSNGQSVSENRMNLLAGVDTGEDSEEDSEEDADYESEE